MPWYHRGEHSDGYWYKFFSTEAAALASIAKFLGRNHDGDGHPLRSGQRYVDTFGGTHRVSETTVPNGRHRARIRRPRRRHRHQTSIGLAPPARLLTSTRRATNDH